MLGLGRARQLRLGHDAHVTRIYLSLSSRLYSSLPLGLGHLCCPAYSALRSYGLRRSRPDPRGGSLASRLLSFKTQASAPVVSLNSLIFDAAHVGNNQNYLFSSVKLKGPRRPAERPLLPGADARAHTTRVPERGPTDSGVQSRIVDPLVAATCQKSDFASCRKTVRFCVKRSRFLASRLFCTSAISRSNAAVSFCCRSGEAACCWTMDAFHEAK